MSVAVITGGSRGIGAALTRALAQEKWTVVVADLHEDGESLTAELREQGSQALFVRTDVSDEASVTELARRCVAELGSIDALVNNAGRYRDLAGKSHFTEISVAEWDRTMEVNARGVWLTSRAVYPTMKAQGRGKIVNIASSTVHQGTPNFAHYVASKGAVIALTRALANESGKDGITVNAIAPGFVDDEASRVLNDPEYFPAVLQRRAIPRAMDPTDLVGAVSFLCSPASDFMTGQTLVVDGGGVFS